MQGRSLEEILYVESQNISTKHYVAELRPPNTSSLQKWMLTVKGSHRTSTNSKLAKNINVFQNPTFPV